MSGLELERISIKRPSNSLDGRFIKYLKLNTLNFLYKDFSDLAFSTLKKHWFPLFLEQEGTKVQQLRQVCLSMAHDLELQASIIREIGGLGSIVYPFSTDGTARATVALPQIDSKLVHQNGLTQLKTKDEGQGEQEDDFLQLQMTDEMLEANKPFGIELL